MPFHTNLSKYPHTSASSRPRLPPHPDRSFHRRHNTIANPHVRRPLRDGLNVVVREEVEEAHFQFVGDEESTGAEVVISDDSEVTDKVLIFGGKDHSPSMPAVAKRQVCVARCDESRILQLQKFGLLPAIILLLRI